MQIFNPTRHIELARRVERRNARLAKGSEDRNARKTLQTASKFAANVAANITSGSLDVAYAALSRSKKMQEQLFDTWECLSNMKERGQLAKPE